MATINGEPDRISCLPGDVIDRILSHLPIREAVRTSVLSKNWRYTWARLPNLVFDRRCVSAASQQPSVIQEKLSTIIDHLLLLHFGPISKFELCDSSLINVSALDRWIFHLSRRSIKELVLGLRKGQLYKLPWCLFSCQSLQHMTLYNCLLIPPSTIDFKNLKSLDLNHVTMAQDSFEYLISGCPRLENLTLIDLDGITQINIHAPNLKILEIEGKFEDIIFHNTFQLAKVFVDLSLYLNSKSNQSSLHRSFNNMLDFFAHLYHVQDLDIDGYFLKYLAVDVVPVKLPTPYINLKCLWLTINFRDLKEISAALCVIRSSPNLEQLQIFAQTAKQAVDSAPDLYCWEDIFLEPAMPMGVQCVWIYDISGIKNELDFIRYLLLNSPLLQQMTVKPALDEKSELILQLLQFKRASRQAEIFYDGKVST